LKQKLGYKKCEFTENVRPNHVLTALHWLLKNCDLYKESGINIDDDWFKEMNVGANEIVQSFMEIQQLNYNKKRTMMGMIQTFSVK